MHKVITTQDRLGYLSEAQRQIANGKTAAQWITELERRGVSPADAELIVAEAEEFNSRAAQAHQATAPVRHEHANDVGNAARLVKRHGASIRFVAESQTWIAWNGKAWAPKGARGAVERYAKATALSIYDEAKQARVSDAKGAEALSKWAHQSCNSARLEAMTKTARSDVEVVWDELDAEPWALNVENGIVDLQTGELRPHDPAELHSKMAAAAFDPEASAPAWEAFLAEVLPDAEVRAWVQRAAGYSACGEVGEHVLPFTYGSGANGKSVFLGVLRNVLGDYAAEAAPELLVARRERGIPVDIADLRGFRFVTTSEIEGGRRMATDVMKRIVGEDVLKARYMRQNFETFRNVTHLWMAANDRPQVDGTDDAVWRRIRMVPFTVTIPPERRDPYLSAKLLAERDGILAWVVAGCLAYQREGLLPPAGVAAATDDYRKDSNPLAEWAETCCALEPDAATSAEALHGSYVAWCAEERYRGKPIPAKSPKWGAALGNLGLKSDRETVDGERVRVWRGVRLAEVASGVIL